MPNEVKARFETKTVEVVVTRGSQEKAKLDRKVVDFRSMYQHLAVVKPIADTPKTLRYRITLTGNATKVESTIKWLHSNTTEVSITS